MKGAPSALPVESMFVIGGAIGPRNHARGRLSTWRLVTIPNLYSTLNAKPKHSGCTLTLHLCSSPTLHQRKKPNLQP